MHVSHHYFPLLRSHHIDFPPGPPPQLPTSYLCSILWLVFSSAMKLRYLVETSWLMGERRKYRKCQDFRGVLGVGLGQSVLGSE